MENEFKQDRSQKKSCTFRHLQITMVIFSIMALTGCGADAKSSSHQSSEANSTIPTNPLNTSDNKSACSAMRFIFNQNDGVISDWANQAATNEDAAKAMQKIGKTFADIGATASGELQSAMESTGMDYKKMYVDLIENDFSALALDLKNALADVTRFDDVCKSIGEA